jgi:hypothetical protein
MSEPKNNARNAFNASSLHRPSMAYTLHDEMVQGPSECRERGNNQRCQKKAQPVTRLKGRRRSLKFSSRFFQLWANHRCPGLARPSGGQSLISMPKRRPCSARTVLISLSTFLPKYGVLNNSISVFLTRSLKAINL